MDALDRIEPVARGMLRDVDAALATLGAPAEHRIWPLLRRLGITPADGVAFFAQARPAPIRAAGLAAAELATPYRMVAVPAPVTWHGAAGELYAARATALNDHLAGDHPASMVARITATASYVEGVAVWMEESRDRIASALATVLTSAQAVTLASGVPEPTRVPALALSAAADIGAYLLEVVAEAVEQGHDVLRRFVGLGDESSLPPRGAAPVRFGATIRLRH